jgi:hypothetical protein
MLKIDQDWINSFIKCTRRHVDEDGFTCIVKTADGHTCRALGKHFGQFQNEVAAKNAIRYRLSEALKWHPECRQIQDKSEMKSAVSLATGKTLQQILDQGLLVIEPINQEES